MINEFKGRYEFLSNFYPSNVMLDGEWYHTVEHAYQAAKTLDAEERKLIRNAEFPGQAKKLGRKVKMRDDWDSLTVKFMIMNNLLRQKFSETELAKMLISTGNEELVEGNYWNDTCWGVDLRTGKGSNHLGKMLMEIRTSL